MVVVEAMFSRGLAGLERASLDYAAMLSARGHEVHFLAPDDAGSAAELSLLAARSGGTLIPHLIPMAVGPRS